LIFDGDVSTGAADDLQRATEIAVEMVTKYGMDPGVGQRT
jgi:cell division protease FtsH